MVLRFLFVLLFLSGCASESVRTARPTLAPDPFFTDQPGALTAEELSAARAAMRAALAPGAELPLFASGRRVAPPFMPAYAVYAYPAEELSGGAVAYRRLGCNFYANDKAWRCGSHAFFQIDAGGAWQAFRYSGKDPLQPSALVADMARHVYSACFEDQYRALVGAPRPTGQIRIHEVLQTDAALLVVTTPESGSDQYAVQRAESAPASCPFVVRNARIGATGKAYPQ